MSTLPRILAASGLPAPARHAVEPAAVVSKQTGAAEASRAERRQGANDNSRQIVRQGQGLDCDLLVWGRHGESMLEALLPGSVSKHALAESQCAVAV